MDLLPWAADQHMRVLVFALAASMMLPYPLLAAQRAGRGIRPWWTATRYLAWVGFIASLAALASGQFLAKSLGLLGDEWIIRGEWSDLQMHQYFGGAAVLLGFLCLRSVYLPRKEHQGIGPLALFAGLAWALLAGGAGHYGIKVAQHRKAVKQTEAPAKTGQGSGPKALPGPAGPTGPARPIGHSESGWLAKILDYPSLQPMHPEPVRSAAHKNRWIRTWVSKSSANAYANGDALPSGTLVVMSTVEDRWGRPTHELGPLYALEVLEGGKPRLGLYWANVPEQKRDEVGGLARVNWREPNENLAGCAECHSAGMADPKARSRVRYQPPRRPAPEE